ncbi:DinB superfamily protein [Bacillus sp. THAF10]|uniref:DinB family protein n=1 Tax=Bacillus sp. THAF10 TaxID=2587848 RepID=UPI001267DC6D|nr:DinB family protein [Bacillus sp. THAF10]QFT87528.1 DinB superfamily protein [Bacillus sp. THAF10]
MNFTLEDAISLLERTPRVLDEMLRGLPERFLFSNEGEGTWNTVEVVDHLIECEKVNFIPRIRFILEEGDSKPFPVFDRFAHLKEEEAVTLPEKLQNFKQLREENLVILQSLAKPEVLELEGTHPAFGKVKMRELIATWAVHDLTHINQITRNIAKRYTEEVGPWKEYLGIVGR